MITWSRIMAGLRAFRDTIMVADLLDVDNFTDWENRQSRYAVNWAIYESTAYQNAHVWASSYRSTYGLYKDIRDIYGPAYEVGAFYQTHLLGGLLDIDAQEAGAIPIVTDDPVLRASIAELWKWSRWQTRKDILTLQGTILGDAFIKIVDDIEHERVYMELIYPGIVKDVTLDPFGNVKAYVIEEERPDPRGKSGTVVYTEIVSREGENVVYETYLNGKEYAWTEEQTARWTLPYGFVPMVMIQHNDIGLDWGWSELHPMHSRIMEVNDLASMLSDQLRKTVKPRYLITGMKPTDLTAPETGSTAARPHPGREEIDAIWTTSTEAKADPMVADLDYESVLLHISNILEKLEESYPELNKDIGTSSGDASGRALRVARQRVVAKVLQRRVNYDDGLVKAQQMAIAMGGFRDYDGYKGFGLDSYASGQLDHSIAARSVFDEDPLDAVEVSSATWDMIGKAMAIPGVTLKAVLLELGWSEDRIKKFMEVEDENSNNEQ